MSDADEPREETCEALLAVLREIADLIEARRICEVNVVAEHVAPLLLRAEASGFWRWVGLSGEEALLKLLKALRSSRSSAVQAIDEYLRAYEKPEEQAIVDIKRNGGIYGRLTVKPGELTAFPAVGLNVEVADLAIQRFLVPKVLDALKRKYGVDYEVESEGGRLKAVRIKGKLEQKDVERLVKAFAWAFEKASSKVVPKQA